MIGVCDVNGFVQEACEVIRTNGPGEDVGPIDRERFEYERKLGFAWLSLAWPSSTWHGVACRSMAWPGAQLGPPLGPARLARLGSAWLILVCLGLLFGTAWRDLAWPGMAWLGRLA